MKRFFIRVGLVTALAAGSLGLGSAVNPTPAAAQVATPPALQVIGYLVQCLPQAFAGSQTIFSCVQGALNVLRANVPPANAAATPAIAPRSVRPASVRSMPTLRTLRLRNAAEQKPASSGALAPTDVLELGLAAIVVGGAVTVRRRSRRVAA